MAQLRQSKEQFEETETEVLIVGPEKQEKFKSYFEEKGINFTGLPDPKHSVLKLYGQEVKLFKLGRLPAQVLIGKDGIVHFGHYGHDMTDIPSTDEMISLIKSI